MQNICITEEVLFNHINVILLGPALHESILSAHETKQCASR